MSKLKFKNKTAIEVKSNEVRWEYDYSNLNFKSTAEVAPLTSIIGQPRALESLRLGAQLYAKGYNMFVTGLSGTGRMTAVKQMLEELSLDTECPITYDYIYVNNFVEPQKPHLLKLIRGSGREFSKMVESSIEFIRQRLPKVFEEEPYVTTRKALIDNYQDKQSNLLSEFDEKIHPLGYVRGQFENEQGILQPDIFPIFNKKPISLEELEQLQIEGKIKKDEFNKVKNTIQQLREELFEISKVSMKLLLDFKKELSDNDKSAAIIIIQSILQEIKDKYENEKVHKFINEVQTYILDNLTLFLSNPETLPAIANVQSEISQADFFNQFKVNLLIDNSNTECAPIIIEKTPNYSNLFGTFERVFDQRGFWRTDFSMIKAGSILQADQGYLIVSAEDLFADPTVWYALKRVLLYGVLELQPADSIFQVSQSHLKPEEISVNIKCIIIGGETLYKVLYQHEKGFKKIFKINAQFDYETGLTKDVIENYIKFIAKICTKENLPHCSPSGVAAILEWAVEHSGNRNRITLKFSDVADLIRESAFYVNGGKNKRLIDAEDVQKAIYWHRKRNDLIDDKMKYQIETGVILIDTEGERVGQINGLTVMDTGLISFGKPARITANISLGSEGIVNIEREANMSGRIHNKGVLILTSFLQEKFARKFPLSFNAYIAFEQNYGGIDGDSATAAEIILILSVLSGLPINQSIAITGSVNQKGDVQPIGGVNEKITGFYELCKARGFNKKQGVIIPIQNKDDLMLNHEIKESIKNGEFQIYTMKQIEDATNLLLGMDLGEVDEIGNATKGTISELVIKKLEKYKALLKDTKTNKSIKSKSKTENTNNDDNENNDDEIDDDINDDTDEGNIINQYANRAENLKKLLKLNKVNLNK